MSSDDAMLMRPSSSTSIFTPVRSTMLRMTGMRMVMMRGAKVEMSLRAPANVSAILPRMCRRPWRRLFERLAHDVHGDGHPP